MNEETADAATSEENKVEGQANLLEQHKELLDRLRVKYDEIAIWPAPPRFGGIIVAAVPESPRVTEKFINEANDPKIDKAISMRNYALASVVHPDRETIQQIFTRKPFLPAKIAARVSELAGAETNELGKD